MTLREANMSAESLFEVRDRSLEENYAPHRFAQNYVEGRLAELGFTPVQHGDEAPEAEEVFFGSGPDIEVREAGETVGYVEVKTKRVGNEEWFGRLNKRHWNDYVVFVEDVDVPVFIYFAVVNEDRGVIERQGFIEVMDTDQIDGDVTDLSNQVLVFRDEATEEIDGTNGGVLTIDPDELIGIEKTSQVVDGIPFVKGNDVVELDQDDLRSWQHVSYRFDEA